MRLLFDENLSPRLVTILENVFPNCQSVLTCGLGGRSDEFVWNYAIAENLIIVSKDLDFAERAVLIGKAKVIWIRLGNCTTEAIHLLLRKSMDRLTVFSDSEDVLIELP